MRYYDIYVKWAEENGAGYSIFISVDGEKEDAVEKAKKEGLFEYELDYNHIRYVKEAWNRPKYLFNLVSSAYIYAVKLPFGNLLASNVSSDLRYNSKDYSVIRQAAM